MCERLNDEERRQWIENDEGLHCRWKQSGLSLREFIRVNRKHLDVIIVAIRDGKKPAHYLVYGG